MLSVYTCSSNNPASLTSRLGATIDVEQNHVRFLGDLVLNLWDCGGQDSFMESYAGSQSATTFQEVGVLIYVFDVESRDVEKDMGYYRDCLDGLKRHSPDAAVFLLVHKVDLVRASKKKILKTKRREMREASGDMPITVFGTSIYDESLYKVRAEAIPICHTLFDLSLTTGLVTYRPYPHPQCSYPLETPYDLRGGL